MLELLNKTQWSAGLYAGWNQNKESQITCVMKRGFSFDQNGAVKPLDLSPEIIESDTYYSKPHESSLLEVNELSPYKLGSETYLFGTAYPEPKKYAMELEYNIVFNDGKRWNKKLRVSGKRTWKKILLGYVISKPEVLEPTLLQYEHAYGGSNPDNDKESFKFNPIGKGFNKSSGWRVMNLELPNIEIGPKYIKSPPQQQYPAGYSPIPIFWEPRKKEVGDSNQSPEKDGGYPYSSKSKISLHNVAPLDQRFTMPFVGGEKISLKGFFDNNLSKNIIEFVVPRINLDVSLIIDKKKTRLSPVFDTLIIDTDKYEFYTICRLGIPWNILDTRKGWVSLVDTQNLKKSIVSDNVRNFG